MKSKVATTVQTEWVFAGDSHVGQLRQNNEDAFCYDKERGFLVVVDGMGGRAAGEVAADIAERVIRTRLERCTGTIRERIREAITLANNEIFQQSQSNPEWAGMACVLTVAVIEENQLTVGHVGDTRLYEIRSRSANSALSKCRIEKITRDHSPIGEREDWGQLTELEAMRHPRRNEVFREVGTIEHEPDDEGFIELFERPVLPGSSFLMCSDGLSDLLTSAQMLKVIEQQSGNPGEVVRQLIAAANDAGGKDNITVVFATMQSGQTASRFAPNAVEPDVALEAVTKDQEVTIPTAATGRGLRKVAIAVAAITAWMALISFFAIGVR